MNGKFIDLTDGTRLEVKVNFGTLYWLTMDEKNSLFRKPPKGKKTKDVEPSERETMIMCGKLVYALLRSNGKKVTFDEALALMPMDLDVLQDMMLTFEEELEKHKKKEQARAYMKNQGSR